MMDKEALIAALQELDTEASMQEFDPNQIEMAEIKAWICEDGYLHQFRMNLAGYDENMPDQKMGIDFFIHLYDFNSDIAISAPTDAIALEAPDINTLFGEFDDLSGEFAETDNFSSELDDILPTDPSAPVLPVKPREDTPAAPVAPIVPGSLTASVYNGGNLRAFPSLQGLVQDQINAFETVQLLAKTSDGRWYKITNARNVTGWVSVTLLTIDPAIATQVPVEPGL